MYKLYKPVRTRNVYRGVFSYLTESVLNLVNFVNLTNETDILYYHDLNNIEGYGSGNLFDFCFIQNYNDYQINHQDYRNIETFNNIINVGCYDLHKFDQNFRTLSEKLINKFFIPNEEMILILENKSNQIPLQNTIGVHRRATDIGGHYNIIDIDKLFFEIENDEFSNIYLMCDNIYDLKKFKNRYGNRLISFEDFTSHNINLPFFRCEYSINDSMKHVMELVSNTIMMSKTKKFICTKSNISSFCVLFNPKLQFKLLT